MKTTKEELQKEAHKWRTLYEELEKRDIITRTTLSDLLDSHEYTQEYGYSSKTSKKVVVRDWLGIAFLIGELKADSNYSTLIKTNNGLVQEREMLRTEIDALKNPNPQ